MNKMKHMVLLGVFIIEIGTFLGMYFFGGRGIKVVKQLKHENNVLHEEIDFLHNTIQARKKEVDVWHNNAFYREKIAREQLHMARKGDEIYLVD